MNGRKACRKRDIFLIDGADEGVGVGRGGSAVVGGGEAEVERTRITSAFVWIVVLQLIWPPRKKSISPDGEKRGAGCLFQNGSPFSL